MKIRSSFLSYFNSKLTEERDGVMLLETPIGQFAAFFFISGGSVFVYCAKADHARFERLVHLDGLHGFGVQAIAEGTAHLVAVPESLTKLLRRARFLHLSRPTSDDGTKIGAVYRDLAVLEEDDGTVVHIVVKGVRH